MTELGLARLTPALGSFFPFFLQRRAEFSEGMGEQSISTMKISHFLKTLFAKNRAVRERNFRCLRQSAFSLAWLVLLSPSLSLALPPISKATARIPRIGEISGSIQWPESASINLPRPFKLVLSERIP